MHGATLKTVDAKQARLHNSFKNTKCKLLRTNAAIWFNKMCRIKQVKPKYINIRIKGQKQQDQRITKQFKADHQRLYQEQLHASVSTDRQHNVPKQYKNSVHIN